MKNLKYYILLGATLLTSCSDENSLLVSGTDKQTTFSEIAATISNEADTRMAFSDGKHLSWSQSDVLGVYSDQQGVEKYSASVITENAAIFRGKPVTGTQFYAFYPYSETVEVDDNNRNILYLSLGSGAENQNYLSHYSGGSYPTTSRFTAPVVAKSTDNSFQFKHICGYLCVTIEKATENIFNQDGTRSGYTFKSITLKGNNGELIAGKGKVDISSETPQFVVDEEAGLDEITVANFQAGSWQEGIKVYIPLPEITFEKGITVTIEMIDVSSMNSWPYVTNIAEVSTDKPVEIKRGMIKSMTALDGKELFENSISEKEIELAKTKAILRDIYDSLGGDDWTNNTNWNSDEPLENWYGLKVVDGKVTRIELYQNNLKGTIPESIGNLKSLEFLSLYWNNNIEGNIPESIGDLPNLYYIDIARNNLGGKIPESIGDMKNLWYLHLSRNNLEGNIPASFGNTKRLGYLFLSYNNLEGNIPENLGNLSNIVNLGVDHNNLTGTIPDVFSTLNGLELFWFNNNNMDGVISKAIQESSWWNDNIDITQNEGHVLTLEGKTDVKNGGIDGFESREHGWGN